MTITRQEAIAQYGEPDSMGHVTRFSDSSLHDEICVLCGLVDGVGYTPTNNIYNTRCYVEMDEPPVVETRDIVEEAWNALKERCCADPANAKKCVMVSKADFTAAISNLVKAREDVLALSSGTITGGTPGPEATDQTLQAFKSGWASAMRLIRGAFGITTR